MCPDSSRPNHSISKWPEKKKRQSRIRTYLQCWPPFFVENPGEREMGLHSLEAVSEPPHGRRVVRIRT